MQFSTLSEFDAELKKLLKKYRSLNQDLEVLKDVSFRLAPLSEKEAIEMMKDIKGFKLLEGFRGEKPVDLDDLAKVITKVGEMMMDLPEIMEIDINPLIVYDKKLVAVDVRIALS